MQNEIYKYLTYIFGIATIILILTIGDINSNLKELRLDNIDSQLTIDRKDAIIYELEEELKNERQETSLLRDEKAEIDRKVNIVTDYILMQNKNLPKSKARQIAEYEIFFAKKYRLPLEIAIAITNHETHFRCGIVSYDNSSYGCKQINVKVWKKSYSKLNFVNVFDPKINISIGSHILSEHIKKTGSIEKAIKKYRGSKHASTNQKYYNAVMKKKHAFAIYFNKRIKEEV